MDSKERVLIAFAHQEPDRVPMDYSANPGMDGRLKERLKLSNNDTEGLLDALGVDFNHFGVPYAGPRLHAEKPGVFVDPCWGATTRWVGNQFGGYWDYCDFPLKNIGDDDIYGWPMPDPDDFDYGSVLDAVSRRDDKFNVLNAMPDVINGTGFLRSMEQTLIDLITDNPAIMNYIDRRMAILLEITRRTLEYCKGGIDCLLLGDDLGTQEGPMISMKLFRKHIRPRHQPFVDLARESGIHVMMHSCGSSSWAFDDFAEMGVTVMDTLQPEAKDMSPAYLKARFGDRLSFHGCISTAGPLAYGTIGEVGQVCRDTLDVMMPGGGYCYCPTHMIQDNTPVGNVMEMYRVGKEYGTYNR